MPGRSVDPKADLIAKAAARASSKKGSGAPPKASAEQFLRQYFRHIAFEDLNERADTDLWGAAVSHYRFAASRLPGVALVRAFTPTVAEHGWSAGGHTVVEVAIDDMPFLVDSVTMELHAEGRGVHLVVHPQLLVRRTITGDLVEVIDDESYAVGSEADVRRESWMHIEIDRETDQKLLDKAVERLCGILSDVRETVEDWNKMHQQVLDVVEDLGDPAAGEHPAVRGRAGHRPALVAGRRPLHLHRLPRVPPQHRRRRGRAAGGARHRARHPACRPGDARRLRQDAAAGAGEGAGEDAPGAGQGQLQVHGPPAGLPRLHRREDLRRRRRGHRRAPVPRAVLLRRLHRVADAHPAAPREGVRRPRGGRRRAREPHRQGAHGRAGELPARRAVPDPAGGAAVDRHGGAADPGAQAAAPLRPARRLPPLPVVPGLPPARPLQHLGPREDLRHPAGGARGHLDRVHRAGLGVHARARALRGPARARRDHGRRVRRPRRREEAGRGRALVERRPGRRHPRRVRREPGQRPCAQVRRRVARGLQGGLPAADRGVRHRRAREHRGRRGLRALLLPATRLQRA